MRAAIQLDLPFPAQVARPSLSDAPAERRRARGKCAHLSGQAAEDQVLADYQRRGYVLAARRWRGRAGEIDLVLRLGETVIFVEVKRARDFDRAAARITPAQTERIFAAAAEFLAGEPRGPMTETRLDAALLDGTGRIEIRENAFV